MKTTADWSFAFFEVLPGKHLLLTYGESAKCPSYEATLGWKTKEFVFAPL
ncbi:hypothetical protein [Bryobacter aggregatus]|nr:hypothetical protein [Bryobacter aggregatus]